MFSPLTRLLLGAAVLALGAWEALRGRWGPAAVCALAAALQVVAWLRCGTVYAAFRALKRGRTDRARALLGKIRWPDLLSARQRAYCEWLSGALRLRECGGDGDLAAAEAHFRRARGGALRTDADRCLLSLALAEIAHHRGDATEARSRIAEARALPRGPEADRILAGVEALLAGRDDPPGQSGKD